MSLPVVLGVLDANGDRVDQPRADGSYAPIILKAGQGVTATATSNGSLTEVEFTAAAGTPATALAAGTQSAAFFIREKSLHVSVDEYVTDMSGGTVQTSQFLSALAAVQPGGVLYLPEGKVLLDGSHGANIDLVQPIKILGKGRKSILSSTYANGGFNTLRLLADDIEIDGISFECDAVDQIVVAPLAICAYAIWTDAAAFKPKRAKLRNFFIGGPDGSPGMGHNNGIKLDTGCDDWLIEHGWLREMIGDDATAAISAGYNILVGQSLNGRIFDVRLTARHDTTIHRGHHGIYLTGGTKGFKVLACTLRGFAQSSIPITARPYQEPCEGNLIAHCEISGQALGGTGSAGISFDGHVRNNRSVGNYFHDMIGSAIAWNDYHEGGLNVGNSSHGDKVRRCGREAFALQGVKNPIIVDPDIADASTVAHGTYAAIDLRADTDDATSLQAIADAVIESPIIGTEREFFVGGMTGNLISPIKIDTYAKWGVIDAVNVAGTIKITLSDACDGVTGDGVHVESMAGALAANGDWSNCTFALISTKAVSGVVQTASGTTMQVVSHGYSDGDVVPQRGIGGVTSAIGRFRVRIEDDNHYAIFGELDNLPITGSQVYTSGGSVGGKSTILLTGSTGAGLPAFGGLGICLARRNHQAQSGATAKLLGALGNTAANTEFAVALDSVGTDPLALSRIKYAAGTGNGAWTTNTGRLLLPTMRVGIHVNTTVPLPLRTVISNPSILPIGGLTIEDASGALVVAPDIHSQSGRETVLAHALSTVMRDLSGRSGFRGLDLGAAGSNFATGNDVNWPAAFAILARNVANSHNANVLGVAADVVTLGDDSWADTYGRAATLLRLLVGGSTVASLTAALVSLNFGLQLNDPSLAFANNVSPLIRSSPDTANGVSGQKMIVRGQNCTGTTTTGGELSIESGVGTSASGPLTLKVGGNVAFQASDAGIGYNGASPTAKPTITGSRGGNAALTNLLAWLALGGQIVDATS